jgi:hypothetical protein
LQVSPVQYLRRDYLHLSYSIDFGLSIVVSQGTPLHITASGYKQKALVAPSADTSPGTLGRICPGGQATMAQFLPVPAKD